MLNVINERYGDLASTQEMLATGKRLLRPSDDPVDTANDLKLKTRVRELEQYHKNVNDGLAFMNVTDTAMQSMNNLLQRLRELTIQAKNDTLSGNERAFIGKEVEQLMRQLITLVNTNYKGDFVFGGTQSKIMPFPPERSYANTIDDYQQRKMAYFDASAGPGTYQLRNAFDDTPMQNIIPGSLEIWRGATQYIEGTDFTIDYAAGAITVINPALAVDISDGGQWETGAYYRPGEFNIKFEHISRGRDIYGDMVTNRGDVLREIESGITMPVNISGDELIVNPEAGVDMIGTTIRLGQALLHNDMAGLSNTLVEIDAVMQTVLSAETKNGARVNRFEITLERNELQTTETTRLHSELEDADLAETVTKFSLLQNVYTAALQSAAKIVQPSLTNFL
jgi:flagellar hook-associated protein 3 FlgL